MGKERVRCEVERKEKCDGWRCQIRAALDVLGFSRRQQAAMVDVAILTQVLTGRKIDLVDLGAGIREAQRRNAENAAIMDETPGL